MPGRITFAAFILLGGFAELLAQPAGLPYRPLFAEYSTALDRIIMASDNPPQVHVYEPVTRTTLSVTLAKPPLSLRLTPDGQRAIVGQDALVTLVNLNNLSIERSYPVAFAVTQVDGNGTWIWARGSDWGVAVSIQIANGAVTPYTQGGRLGDGRFSTRLNALFITDTYSGGVTKVDVSSGPLGLQTTSNTTAFSGCSPLLLNAAQSAVITGCGGIWETGNTATDALRSLTRLNAFASGSAAFRALAESPSRGQIGAIPNSSFYSNLDESWVWLFDNGYYNPAGRVALSEYGGGHRARGRWLFFNNASSVLYVISQADATANLTLDFGVHTIPLDPPTPCGALVNPTAASAPAGGIMGTLSVTAGRDCRYVPNPDSAWLQVVDPGLGSGNNTLTYIVRPNFGTAPRTGSIAIGGATFTVTQDGATALGPLRRLGYPVAAAEYSRPLDRLVLVSSNPRELHLYDPVTGDDQILSLPRPATSVAVNPAGNQAVVGHDGFVSYASLNPLLLANIYSVYNTTQWIQLGRTGFAYFNTGNYYYNAFALNLTNRALTMFSTSSNGRMELAASGDFLYTNSSFGKWDVRQGAPVSVPSNQAFYYGCEAAWFLPDGLRFLNTCAQLYDVSSFPAAAPVYAGAVAGLSAVQTADYAAARRSFALAPSAYQSPVNQLRIVGDQFLAPAGTLTFPQLTIGTGSNVAYPLWTFWNNAQDSIVTVLRAGDGSASSAYFVHVLSANPPDPGCTITPQRTLVGASLNGGFDSVSVVAGPSCAWLASTTANWITVTSGAFGIGSANIALSIAANTTGAPRSATLNVAGTNVTITQAAVACTYAISANAFSAGAGSTAGSVNVTAPAGCGWNAISNAAWITFSGASGIGNGTVNFSVAANTGSTFRTGTFTVNGLLYTVTQARQGAPDPIFNDVPPSSPYYDYIAQMSQNNITAGCSANPPLYCPDTPVTRAQMAVFIVAALNKRLGTTLTYSPTPYFNDMQPVSGYFPFVQRIKELGITAGCSITPPLYCSDNSITHGQMAVFIIASWMQANNLTSFTHPTTPYFTDVPATHPFFRFIQKMRELGFWNGCSANQYCDGAAVTRAHMSPMIMKGILGAP